jgi:hypothetical protein
MIKIEKKIKNKKILLLKFTVNLQTLSQVGSKVYLDHKLFFCKHGTTWFIKNKINK